MVGGMLALAAGVGALALLPVHVALGWLLARYLVIGAGYAVLSAPVNTVAVSSMPRDQAGSPRPSRARPATSASSSASPCSARS